MASTGCSTLSRSGASPRFPLLRFWRRRRPVVATADQAAQVIDPLLEAGRLLRQRREESGLNLRQLALRTRISTAVLEALERGWRERLPEPTYLRAMLPLIETELALPAGSLDAALPSDTGAARRRPRRRFTPGSIDVFSTWQGTVLYGALTLGLIYALNLEQQRLAAAGLLALRPVPALPADQQQRPTPPGQRLLRIHPELRPLEQAALGQGLHLLRQSTGPVGPGPGLLELDLSQDSRVTLTAGTVLRLELEDVSGQLRLPITPPFQLSLDPSAVEASRVLWNGAPLRPLRDQPGVFRVGGPTPRPAAAASAP